MLHCDISWAKPSGELARRRKIILPGATAVERRSRTRRWCEKAAAGAVPAFAAPVLAVFAAENLSVGHHLGMAGELIANPVWLDLTARNDKAVVLPAAPFPICRAAIAALGNPGIVGRRRGPDKQGRKEEESREPSKHGQYPFVVLLARTPLPTRLPMIDVGGRARGRPGLDKLIDPAIGKIESATRQL